MTDQTAAFVPPAAENLPPGVLDSATDGASALDAGAREPAGRNFLAHALVRLARDGWLRTEPGEGFEVVRDRETPEPTPAGQAPATDRAGLMRAHVALAEQAGRDQAAIARVRRLHDQLETDTGLASPDDEITRGAAARKIAAALDGWSPPAESVLPAPADRAAEDRIRALHQPMQRGPFTICAHCSGWDGEWRCLGVVTDYPCPTLRALDGETQAETAPPVHLGGQANAEDCPACKGTNPPYPFLCPGADGVPTAVGAQQPKEARS